MKKFLLVILAVIINVITANCVLAENFYIENYDVKMNVTENKNVLVTETIDVVFRSPSHGIYRTIPAAGKDKISNIKTEDKFSVSKSQGQYKIKIGDPNKWEKPYKRYAITYNYHMDKIDNNDFYFNIIGTEWNVPIKKVNFDIKMPKQFNPENAGLSIGRYGTRGFDGDAVFQTDGLRVVGHTKRVLHPKEGITIRIDVGENYFKESGSNTGFNEETYTILCIALFALTAFLMWLKFGKDDPVIPVVTFYPPKNRNSAEVGVEYKLNASEKDIISLIFYLASKGYIKIEDNDKNFTIIKLKEYDGQNSIEKSLMEALFCESEGIITKKELEKSSTFYIDCIEIQNALNMTAFDKIERDAGSITAFLTVIFCIIGIIFITLYSFAGYSMSDLTNQIYPNFNGSVLACAIAGFIISVICMLYMSKRNKISNKRLGEILGFKKFLEVADKKRIELLLDENPEYCFDVLPFAYVLDVSDKWIEKFESIIKTQPKWYTGSLTTRSFNRLSKSLEHVSKPSTQNGGISRTSSSGGGGFSDGGRGGGGGGSW